ncbi:MAG: 6-bladed beta-propeller [Bacteroides intestinalis]|nr:6-bladed beta-propeller [Bacteroides intestinalis]
MGKNIYLLVGLLLMLVSCVNDKKGESADNILLFDIAKSVKFQMVSSLSPDRIINLAFSDSTMIDGNASLLYDETYFVYSKGSAIAPMRFDKEGNFLNYIGRVGNGPKEYNKIGDVCLNRREKTVEILSGSYVYVYDYQGKYVDKLDHKQTAFSFAIDKDGYHWFYLGNNSVNGEAKMVRMGAKCQDMQKFLQEESTLLPMVEANFGRGAMLTFKETLNHDIYRISDGEIKKSYSIDFPNYHLPQELHKTAPMEVVPLLQKSDYASILNYSENQKYLFLQVLLNKSGQMVPEIYYWIYQKSSGKDIIFSLDQSVPFDSYICYPQFLSEDDRLYFMGFLLDKEIETTGSEENPAIVIIDVSSLVFS